MIASLLLPPPPPLLWPAAAEDAAFDALDTAAPATVEAVREADVDEARLDVALAAVLADDVWEAEEAAVDELLEDLVV